MNTAHSTPRRDHAREIRESLTDVPAVCERLGVRCKRDGTSWKILCPWHQERTPSCSLSLGADRTLRVKCFGCDKGGDVLALIAAVRGFDTKRDFPQVLRAGAELAGLWGIVGELDGRISSPSRLPASAPTPIAASKKEPTYPPVDEVLSLWAACIPVNDDAEAVAWLASRRLDATLVDDFGLARVLPEHGVAVHPWNKHWPYFNARLLIPLFDACGQMRSFKARNIKIGADKSKKSIAAKDCSCDGLVMADGIGQWLLQHGEPLEDRETEIVIVEGEPDFLTRATLYSSAYENPPAVLGIYSGSWSDAISARIPDKSEVIIRTHLDESGEKYQKRILETLAHRCTTRIRKRPS